ncbi:hypothetical protein L3V79_02625 [Thiotrichales bacterium 19S9-12]|nr:hypothetical protein [Thiotrichales bacterium 19S9-11]MCF6811253.1 hypothetical protein [Thiotrichales bacterium 19S9-12]
MQKIQVMVDDQLAISLKESAKKAGLSISSYARLLISSAYKKNMSSLEKSMLDTSSDTHYSGEDYLANIQKMIKDA